MRAFTYWASVRAFVQDTLLRLWAEQHAGQPVQMQFNFYRRRSSLPMASEGPRKLPLEL